MLGMFWIAVELSNPKMGLITGLSLLVSKLIAIRFDEIAKFGNTGGSGPGLAAAMSLCFFFFLV